MNFISIGGWCGTKVALKELGYFDEPSLPFDSVRSSIEGIIDCIENDFENFFPLIILSVLFYVKKIFIYLYICICKCIKLVG